ncbi:hypothetical protein CFP56_018796 [Quercus suber]|uniref:Uncharacterized protein n=1 Tax=Quercus suber TaxID=58331 RepID=A0AAW0KJ16_QUESU
MTLAEDLKLQETPNSSKNVVIVMDGMQEFTTEPLEWALKNVIEEGCIVTLLGIMPWLNIRRRHVVFVFVTLFKEIN